MDLECMKIHRKKSKLPINIQPCKNKIKVRCKWKEGRQEKRKRGRKMFILIIQPLSLVTKSWDERSTSVQKKIHYCSILYSHSIDFSPYISMTPSSTALYSLSTWSYSYLFFFSSLNINIFNIQPLTSLLLCHLLQCSPFIWFQQL